MANSQQSYFQLARPWPTNIIAETELSNYVRSLPQSIFYRIKTGSQNQNYGPKHTKPLPGYGIKQFLVYGDLHGYLLQNPKSIFFLICWE